MNKSVLKTAAALTAAAMITFNSGCSESGKPVEQTAGFKPSLDTNTTCSISVYGNYGNFEALETEFAAFNEYYPNVELSYTNLDNYNSSIEAAIKSSEAPNIYMMWHWMIDKEEYRSLFDASEDLSDSSLGINLSCIKSGLLYKEQSGKVPMAPIFSTTYGMLVNEDLFTREGLSLPTTYKALCDACKSLKEKGYKSPIMGYNAAKIGSSISYVLSYPHFAASLVGEPGTVSKLNALDTSVAETLRPTLEHLSEFMSLGFIDINECAKFENNYDAVIYRFFEGDVPMMLANGDVASGTRKREKQSEAFTANPFTYKFYNVPICEKGAYFLDLSSIQFAVNSNCADLDMTNEFMRFLISTDELNNIARNKRLVAVTNDMPLDSIYSPLANTAQDHIIFGEDIGLLDDPVVQMRSAAYKVINGEMTVDEAVGAFGTFKDE